MSARLRWTKASGAVLLMAVLSLASLSSATAQSHKKSKKAPPPPLPSGPTGPVQQIPLDSIAAVPPQVSFQNNQLTIVAPNSTLSDILRAVKKLTGAEIDLPSAPERVVTRLGPGPVREVMAELLNGSRFNYVLLGSPDDQNGLSRVVLVAKSGVQDVTPNPNPAQQEQGMPPQPGMPQQVNFAQPQQEAVPEASEVDPAAEENATPDDNNDQNSADADQQQDNPGVKTPQQMLQEMQQRQLQLQQNQPPGQPPIPGSGMPPHPPQEQ